MVFGDTGVFFAKPEHTKDENKKKKMQFFFFLIAEASIPSIPVCFCGLINTTKVLLHDGTCNIKRVCLLV